MKLTFNGVRVDASREQFREIDARGGVRLSDGTVLRVKPVITGIFRLHGISDQNGDPVYHVSFVPAAHIVSVPEEEPEAQP